jgi:proteasome lid subunit RPN8/RPN11
MTDPEFIHHGVTWRIPFRPRSVFRGLLPFADQAGVVLIEAMTPRRLREAAVTAQPNETGGLLLGRVFRDAEGAYVVVLGHIEAPNGAGRPESFELSPENTKELRENACLTNPAADIVGWWHSHSSYSEYSETDLSSQQMWIQQESVGILVFAGGNEWGLVYQGPDARRLPGPSDVPSPAEQGRLAFPEGGRMP